MFTNSKSFTIWLFGFISGFTLMITSNTLNFWLAKENIDLKSISLFALILIPYSINFLWAPIFDTVKLGLLSKAIGQSLSWVCVIQIILALFILLLSCLSPVRHIILFASTCFIISLLSSAGDAILGALRTEIVAKESQGSISGIYIFGYRIGMLASSSGAIYLSIYISWSWIYTLFAVVVFMFPFALVASRRSLGIIHKHSALHYYPERYCHPERYRHPERSEGSPLRYGALMESLRSAQDDSRLVKGDSSVCSFRIIIIFWMNVAIKMIKSILEPIGSCSFILLILAFLILYRLPDNFISVMINPFLLHIGYDEFDIASTGKFFGVVASIIGGLLASFIMKKRSVLDSLLMFGIIHALCHLLFIIQEIHGKNLGLLFIIIGIEGITGGMTMAAYIAFIASLCGGKFRTSQYAFFSSMMGWSRSILPACSGYIVLTYGWHSFFVLTTFATIPPLLLLRKIRHDMQA